MFSWSSSRIPRAFPFSLLLEHPLTLRFWQPPKSIQLHLSAGSVRGARDTLAPRKHHELSRRAWLQCSPGCEHVPYGSLGEEGSYGQFFAAQSKKKDSADSAAVCRRRVCDSTHLSRLRRRRRCQ